MNVRSTGYGPLASGRRFPRRPEAAAAQVAPATPRVTEMGPRCSGVPFSYERQIDSLRTACKRAKRLSTSSCCCSSSPATPRVTKMGPRCSGVPFSYERQIDRLRPACRRTKRLSTSSCCCSSSTRDTASYGNGTSIFGLRSHFRMNVRSTAYGPLAGGRSVCRHQAAAAQVAPTAPRVTKMGPQFSV